MNMFIASQNHLAVAFDKGENNTARMSCEHSQTQLDLIGMLLHDKFTFILQ